jgi:hypothetical protein
MNIAPVSFGIKKTSIYGATHNTLNKVADKYTKDTPEDKLLIQQAHDVLDIVPWSCSEGDTIDTKDRLVSDGFMETLKYHFNRGNKALAYAMGSLISNRSLAGRASNCGFDDLPLGKIENLKSNLSDIAYVENPQTGIKEKDPEMAKIERFVADV